MMVALLTWLWDAIVQLVSASKEPLQYITWIGVAKAPLHVAGKCKVKGTTPPWTVRNILCTFSTCSSLRCTRRGFEATWHFNKSQKLFHLLTPQDIGGSRRLSAS